MINDLIKYFENKKILILGFGIEGQSTYKLIRKYLKEQVIYIADKQENLNEKYDYLKEDKNVRYEDSSKYLENLNNYDIIMKSPGIALLDIDTSKFIDKIKSQLELLLEFFNVFTIGITGTKGKSTTSSLIYKIIEDQKKDALLLGNIGIPVFDYIDTIKEDIILVLEMSSHQLEYMKLSPNVAILLNIYEEHLDHYSSLDKYIEAKCNIYRFQNENDYFLYNFDNELLSKAINKYKIKSKGYPISLKNKIDSKTKNRTYYNNGKIYINDKPVYDADNKRKLLGEHNLNNIMFALAVSEILQLDLSKTTESINNFESLPHRMELVGTYDDIIFYNDSIATIPEATINAVEALENVNTLIIGGMDRGIDFTKFIEYLNNGKVENIICMPKTGHMIADKINNKNVNVYKVEDLNEAVKVAKKVTKKQKICLLSPAAASYEFFKNFKEKGDMFKKIVRE